MLLLRQTYHVARLDLASALRSRRALAMLLLYVVVVLGATLEAAYLSRPDRESKE